MAAPSNEEQQDEIDALECIFNTEEEEKAWVEVDMSEGISAPEGALLGSAHALFMSVSIDDELPLQVRYDDKDPPGSELPTPSRMFGLLHLPPLTLKVGLHSLYPSKFPPLYELSCEWLSESQMAALCAMLDDEWRECPGEPVLFRWAERLREDIFDVLGICLPLTLTPRGLVCMGEECARDDRGSSLWEGIAKTLPYLLEYDRAERRRRFFVDSHCCDICCDDKSGSKFQQLVCKHAFCRDCIVELCSNHIASGSVTLLFCPEGGCRQQIMPTTVKSLVSDELYQRYERLLLAKTLESLDDVIFCPRQQCQNPALLDEANHLGVCEYCHFSFCSLCFDPWHAGRPCLSPDEKLRLLQLQSEERSRVGEPKQSKRAKQAEMLKLMQEINTLKVVRKDCVACPGCKTLIEKIGGCNKMTCSNCHTYFCWLCDRKIAGYNHFGGKCGLFVTARASSIVKTSALNTKRKEALAQNKDASLVAKCPECHAKNLKENRNNQITCLNCRSSYCGECSKRIKPKEKHFGPGLCKQHS